MRALVVCPVLPHPPISGGQKRTMRLLEALERAGARPHLVSADDAAPEAAEALRRRGWDVDVVREPPATLRRRAAQHLARRPSPYLTGVAARIGVLAPEAALLQLEHTQSAYYSTTALPTILSLQNLDSRLLARVARSRRPGTPAWAREWNRALATRSTERRDFPRADLVVCVSQEDAAAAALAGARTLLAPNGVDPEFFDVEPGGGEGRAAFFGHHGYEPNRRGLEHFLEHGWQEVRRRRPDATLAIAGAGLDEPLSRRFAAHDGVEVLGLVDDVAALLAGVSAVVVPVWEGGGTRLKVLEALAAARPVAGTAVGVECIGFVHGREGLIADDPAGLGEALGHLLAEPEEAAAMGVAGRRLAEGFRWERTLAELEAVYRGYLDTRRRRSRGANA
jgi:polysaccharide biosynthesis protein PslH